jgi:hypothetical protein
MLAVLLVLVTALVVALVVVNRGEHTRRPAIFLSPEFDWSSTTQVMQLSVPTTGHDPGPTVQLRLQHQRGFGSYLHATDLHAAALANGERVLSTVIAHMRAAGWSTLFVPASASVDPSVVLYVTFRAGSDYCFVEYVSVRLDQSQAPQILDIYYA